LNTSAADPAGSLIASLLAVWRVLWNNKVLIIACALVAAGIAVYLALTAKPMFRGEVTVAQVDNQQMGMAGALAGQFGGLANLVGVNLGALGGDGREIQALLKSRRLAEEFVVRKKLVPLLYPDTKPLPTLWFAVRHFRDSVVSIHEDKRSGLTQVSVTWDDPVTAATLANEYVGLANELMRARAIAESQASIDYLNAQMLKTDEVQIRNGMFNLIESETKRLMLANVKSEYALAVIDPAVPPELRYSPRRTLMVILGFLIGGVLGTIIAFVRHIVRQARAA
jgi:uncharacterized protein involved in exopolysaccharide biosynthesis